MSDIKKKLAEARAGVGEAAPDYVPPELDLTAEEELAIRAGTRRELAVAARRAELAAQMREKIGHKEMAEELYKQAMEFYQMIGLLDLGEV